MLTPVLVLRFGLGLTLLYAGVHMLVDPTGWLGFVPAWVGSIIAPEIFLYVHAGFEIVLGLFLLFNFLTPIASFIVFLDFLSILIFYGIDEVTFRDFGLMMASLALFLWTRPVGK